MVASECLQQVECDRVCTATGTPGRQQQSVSCDPAVGRTQQALHPGVRSLRSDPHARDAGQACWPDPRGELHADVAECFSPT